MDTNIYDIRREDPGKFMLLDHPEICRFIFHSNLKQWYPDFSDEQVSRGWDFTLENGLNVDLKSNVGEYKPGRYYDKLCLSVKRDGEDCLLNKENDLFLFITQTSADYIEFFTINKRQVQKLIETQTTTKPIRAGGRMQEMLIIDFENPFVTRYVPIWDVKQQRLVKRGDTSLKNLAEVNVFC